MEHLVHSCHTGALEVFHGSLLKYCPKRQEFGYPHMQARMHLAVLDNNMNINRKQAVVKRATKSTGAVGTPRFTMAYSKAQRKWVAKVYEAKSYQYIQGMMADSIKGFEGKITYEEVQNPVRPANMAKVPKPDKTVLVSQLKSRFVSSSPSVALGETADNSPEESTEEESPGSEKN